MSEHIYGLSRERVEELRALMRRDRADLSKLAAQASPRAASQSPRGGGGVLSVIPVYGLIEQRQSIYGQIMGGTSTETIGRAVRQAEADPEVRATILDVASPGGSIFGLTELARIIRNARQSKPIVAVINPIACSAAYWIAASASEIVCSPDGITGSVGVYSIHEDVSAAEERAGIKTEIISAGEYKADAVEGSPLSTEGRKAIQAMVDHTYNLFVADIAAGRRVPASRVLAGYGRGLIVTASAAKAAGMVDRIGTFDETIGRLAKVEGRAGVGRASGMSAEEARLRFQAAGLGLPWPNRESESYDGEAERRIRKMAMTI